MRSSAAAQHASMRTDAAAIAEQHIERDLLAEPSLAPSKVETSSKAHASKDVCEELISLTQLRQPRDRQLPPLEVHEASLPPIKEAHSSYSSPTILDSMQHAKEVLPGGADANSAAPINSSIVNAEQELQTVQQHNHIAARALAGPLGSTGATDTQDLDQTSEQHEQQAGVSQPRLQPVFPDQPTSMASVAPTGEGPAEAEHQHNKQQLGSSVLTGAAARAGSASEQHIADVQSMSDSMLQHKIGVEHSAQQQASTEERKGPVQEPSSSAECMSAAAECIGVGAVGDVRDAARLNGSSSAASAIRPAAAPARSSAYTHSMHHPADQAVPAASVGAGAGSDSQTKIPDQQQGPSLPAHSSVPAATGEVQPAQSQHNAETALAGKGAERTRSPCEGSSSTAQTTLPAMLASSSSDAQPASSDVSQWKPHAADANGRPSEERAVSSTAPSAADAGPTHALGTEDRQPEIQDGLGHMGASTQPLLETTQAGSDPATQHAESEGATQEELLALAESVSRLEADLADAREAGARHERAAEAARQEAARWQDREADARAQVLLVIPSAVQTIPYNHLH